MAVLRCPEQHTGETRDVVIGHEIQGTGEAVVSFGGSEDEERL
jgi:hypothetical protein